jgi:hypothetical protein
MTIRYLKTCFFTLAIVAAMTACRAANDAAPSSEVLDATSSGDAFKDSEEKLFSGNVIELHILVHGDTFNKMVTHKNNGGHACDDDAP